MLTVSTYKSLLTKNKTMVVVSNGGRYGLSYREAHIRLSNGKFYYAISDGYNYITLNKGGYKTLKGTVSILKNYFNLGSI